MEPPLQPHELVDTLHFNACAVLSVLFAVTDVMEAQASQLLTDLANEFQSLEQLTHPEQSKC